MGLNYCKIGRRIKEIRKRNQLSQSMLSELIDKSPTYISYIESGYKIMSLETFVLIANALEIPGDWLLSEQIKSAPKIASQEITMILSDCTAYERLIIIDTVKSLKSNLQNHKCLLKRSSFY